MEWSVRNFSVEVMSEMSSFGEEDDSTILKILTIMVYQRQDA